MYKNIISFITGLVVLWCFSASSGNGKTLNPYLIQNVFISANGSSPTDARNNAVKDARREAFNILLDRLSIDQEFTGDVTEEEISDMVRSQQISNEKIAGNNYSAYYDITFSKGFVTSILDEKNINKDTIKEDYYLIFPVKKVNKDILLWEENNDWKYAWGNVLKENYNPRIKLPRGDIDDISMINHGTVYNGDFKDFVEILKKYNADIVVIAYFNFDRIDNKINITLKQIKQFQEKQTKLSFVNIDNLDPLELLYKVAKRTIKHVVKEKKVAKIKNLNPDQSINIDVLISDLSDWLLIERRLRNMGFVKEMKVNSIAKGLVRIVIQYDENDGDIIELFEEYNLVLMQKEEGHYFLSF